MAECHSVVKKTLSSFEHMEKTTPTVCQSFEYSVYKYVEYKVVDRVVKKRPQKKEGKE